MSECKCDLRIKLVGDGCRYCNPQEYIDNLIESLEEKRTWEGFTTEEVDNIVMTAWPRGTTQTGYIRDIEARLKEKNT